MNRWFEGGSPLRHRRGVPPISYPLPVIEADSEHQYPLGDQALRELRREMRTRRRILSDSDRRHRSQAIIGNLKRSRLFCCATRIACYLPNDGEANLTPLIRQLNGWRKQCFLPVLDTLRPRRLWFAPYDCGDRLIDNRYGIPEPALAAREYVAAWHLDLILVPLVAFDEGANRLGMGGGYYDRTLAFRRRRTHWHRPRLLGIAFECQRVDTLPVRPWDIPLNGVVTETRTLLVR